MPIPPTRKQLVDRYGEPDDIAIDPDQPTNFDRVQWALRTLSTFAEITHNVITDGNHIRLDELSAEWAQELIGDLICNLLHVGVYVGCDADDLITRGLHHFTCEVGIGYGDLEIEWVVDYEIRSSIDAGATVLGAGTEIVWAASPEEAGEAVVTLVHEADVKADPRVDPFVTITDVREKDS